MDVRTTESMLFTRSRRLRLVVLSAAVLLLHASVLGGVDWAWPERETLHTPAMAMQVRTVLLPETDGPDTAAVAPPAVPTKRIGIAGPRPPLRPSRQAEPSKVEAAAADSVSHDEAAIASPHVPAAMQPAAMQPVVATVALNQTEGPSSRPAAQAASASASAGDDKVPVYRTRMPPPLTLRYLLRRGMLSGTGELQWRPAADHYTVQLEGHVAGLTLLTQISTGGFDAGGLAPLRFTDQRLRRTMVAANFQREAGKITFSGPSTELPVMPGEQDRVSWMVQLAAIAAAEPQLLVPGGRIAMHVVGARADVGVWSFRYVANEPVSTRTGTVQAIKLIREPQDAHDTQAEVWLDPQRHFLPVRATLGNGNDGDTFDLILQEWVEPP